MNTAEKKILNHQEVLHRVQRISYQIYEEMILEKEVTILGIVGGGFLLASLISDYLSKISPLIIHVAEVKLDKKNPMGGIHYSVPKEKLQQQALVLVDDVLNSGSTLMHVASHVMSHPPRIFKIAVLVNRSHKRYPVKADFKGISLSTSSMEHVEVRIDRDHYGVFIW